MTISKRSKPVAAFWQGVGDAVPVLGGYVPVAISFGLVAVQAGLSVPQVFVTSALMYSGAAQFLFVGMLGAGSPLWLAVALILLINLRHLVYAPSLQAWMGKGRAWPWMLHGLTDEVFALTHGRLAQLAPARRAAWFGGAALLAWSGWLGGSVIGALVGEELNRGWPWMGQMLPFALPALFMVLLAPRLGRHREGAILLATVAAAGALTLAGWPSLAIPLAAALGVLAYLLPLPAGLQERGYGE